VVVLDRDRHGDLIAGLREVGARVMLITDGDVAPSIAAAREDSGVDLLMGVGGTPEGVISASALKCLGGTMQGKLWPRNDDERQRLLDDGFDIDRVLGLNDLVSGNDVFVAATGVTTGSLLRGVRYDEGSAVTESIVMRSRSTARRNQPRTSSKVSTQPHRYRPRRDWIGQREHADRRPRQRSVLRAGGQRGRRCLRMSGERLRQLRCRARS
jgi:fructose-1,6-bisphosphatase/sedoheptulose 1,7-bisphosphatase-like protein